MKLIAKIKLLPTPKQEKALLKTLAKANEACDYISAIAWKKKCFSKKELQKLTYHYIRKKFKISAQITIRCLSKVADAYKKDKKTICTFKSTGAIAYDSRILSYNFKANQVSIWTMAGRLKIAYIVGDHQENLLKNQKGETDLCLVRGKYYLNATCDVATPAINDLNDYLGVDLGIVQLATTSENIAYSGQKIEDTRQRYQKLRDSLQCSHPAKRGAKEQNVANENLKKFPRCAGL